MIDWKNKKLWIVLSLLIAIPLVPFIYSETVRQVWYFSDDYYITFDSDFPRKWHIGVQDGFKSKHSDLVRAYVSEEILEKKNVLTIEDNDRETLIEVARRFGFWQSGIIEFDIAGEGIIDESRAFTIHICQQDFQYNPKGDIIIRFGKNNKIQLSNPENTEIQKIKEKTWYRIKIEFNATKGFKLWVDGIQYKLGFPYHTEWHKFYKGYFPEYFSQLYFYSFVSDKGEDYKLYIDNINITRVV